MTRAPQSIDAIVVHCSATRSGDVRSIRRYHVAQRGWADIGYHFVIRTDGEIEVGRPLDQSGAHVKGANLRTIGVCLVGDTEFSEAQVAALRCLVRTLRWACGQPTLPVRAHCEYPSAQQQGKTCPNIALAARGVA